MIDMSDKYVVIFDTGLQIDCGWKESGLRTAKTVAGDRTDARIVKRNSVDEVVTA